MHQQTDKWTTTVGMNILFDSCFETKIKLCIDKSKMCIDWECRVRIKSKVFNSQCRVLLFSSTHLVHSPLLRLVDWFLCDTLLKYWNNCHCTVHTRSQHVICIEMGSIEAACISGFLCRLCSEMHRTVIHIYGDQGQKHELAKKINAYLPVTVS